MLDSLGFRQVLGTFGLPLPRSNRGYAPWWLIEQFIVAIWCGASRFAHAETVRFDRTLTRLFGWERVAGHQAIVRLFERFDRLSNERVQAEAYRWLFRQLPALKRMTLDLDSTVITRHGEQAGATRGDNPGRRGRPSPHPLLAFVAEARRVANFWRRPGNTHSANNALQFLEATLHPLGEIGVGLELTEVTYQAHAWSRARRLIVVRQSVTRKQAPGKNLSLFADDPDLQGWRYGAFATTLDLPAAEVWRTYRGRADCENRQDRRFARAAPEGCGIGICRMITGSRN